VGADAAGNKSRYIVRMTTKLCRKCGIEQDISNFGRRGGNQSHLYKSNCKSCLSKMMSAYNKLPYIACKRSVYRKQYWIYHKDTESASNALWVSNNRDVRRSINKKYAVNNKEKVAFRNKKRRASKNGSKAEFSLNDWVSIVESFNHCCAYCLKHENICGPLTQEHIVPFSKGGEYSVDNIIPACRFCNSSKHNKSLLQFIFKWIK
jgi:hypothetical protein